MPLQAWISSPSALGLLSCNAVLSVHKTWGLLWRHGYLANIIRLVADEGSTLPGSNHLLLKLYTGIRPLDRLIAISTVMLANVTDGTMPSFSLFGFYLSGQLLAIQCVVFVRACRENRSRYPAMLWLLLMQLVTYGDAMPFYCMYHLLTYEERKAVSGSIERPPYLPGLPWSIVLGYVIPTVAMAIPLKSNTLHQWFSGFWQGYPVWMVLIQLVLESLSSVEMEEPRSEEDREPHMPIDILPDRISNPKDIIDQVYRFALGAAAFTHLSSLGLITLNALFSAILPSCSKSSITFLNTFWSPKVTASGSANDMMLALASFLLSDFYYGSLASICWAYVLFKRARKGRLDFLFPHLFADFLLGGPSAVVVALMWSLDAAKSVRTIETEGNG